MPMIKYEQISYCVVCDNDIDEGDSLFGSLNFICPNLDGNPNDEIGPLCDNCYEALFFVGFIQ